MLEYLLSHESVIQIHSAPLFLINIIRYMYSTYIYMHSKYNVCGLISVGQTQHAGQVLQTTIYITFQMHHLRLELV